MLIAMFDGSSPMLLQLVFSNSTILFQVCCFAESCHIQTYDATDVVMAIVSLLSLSAFFLVGSTTVYIILDFRFRAVTLLRSERASLGRWRCLLAPSSRWARLWPGAYGASKPEAATPKEDLSSKLQNPSVQARKPDSKHDTVDQIPPTPHSKHVVFCSCRSQGSRSGRAVRGPGGPAGIEGLWLKGRPWSLRGQVWQTTARQLAGCLGGMAWRGVAWRGMTQP